MVSILGKLAVLAIIVGAGWMLGAWLKDAVRAALRRSRLDPLVQGLAVQMVQPVTVFVAIYAALSTFQVDLSPLLVVFTASSLAIALALRDSLSGIAAGALLLTTDPYDGGDWVEIGGKEGTLVEFDLLTVTIKTGDGVLVTLPNELVFGSPILNYTRNGLRRAAIAVTVAHGTKLDKASAALLGAISADERVLDEPQPFVRVDNLGLDGTTLTAYGWLKQSEFGAAQSDLMIAAENALSKAKISRARRASASA